MFSLQKKWPDQSFLPSFTRLLINGNTVENEVASRSPLLLNNPPHFVVAVHPTVLVSLKKQLKYIKSASRRLMGNWSQISELNQSLMLYRTAPIQVYHTKKYITNMINCSSKWQKLLRTRFISSYTGS